MATNLRHARSSLLAAIDWASVSRIAAREVASRDKCAPAVSTYRWWARRPHSVMGALLDVAMTRFGPELLVSDPFSGGGTVAFEATRRGLRTYAQDLYPWPTYGLATALAWVDETEFAEAAKELMRRLASCEALYMRADGRLISHVLRARKSTCSSCALDFFDLPAPMLSLLSRALTEKRAFFCCAACAAVSIRFRHSNTFQCASCGLLQSATATLDKCPHCAEAKQSAESIHSPSTWIAVLVSEVHISGTNTQTKLRTVERNDPVGPYTSIAPRALRARIPVGHETNRLLAAGFNRWSDLYSGRQLMILRRAIEIVKSLDISDAIKDRLALCVLGAAEMPGFTSRWDRFHLKPFEGLANHRYSCSSIAAECNFLSPVGRGTLGRRIDAARKALHWLQADGAKRSVTTRGVSSARQTLKSSEVLIVTGSSQRQVLSDRSVTIVLTDPPYHDDVQYGELARLFHAWLRVYRPVVRINENQEAVPNSYRPGRETAFETKIAACLEESHRTLQRDGVLLLTFHNKHLLAWRGLAHALHYADFSVKALAVVRAENGNDHGKRNVDAMLDDLVIECVKRSTRPIRPRLAFRPNSVATKNLAAIGLAMANAAWSGNVAAIREEYLAHLAQFRGRKRLIT